MSEKVATRSEFIPRSQISNVNLDQYILLVVEVERLNMINRELIRENDSLQLTKGPISAEKVKQLLAENEKLNILVNELSKELSLVRSNLSLNELQSERQFLAAEVDRLNKLLNKKQYEPLSVKSGPYQRDSNNQPQSINLYTQDLSTQPQSINALPLQESVFLASGFAKDQSLGHTALHSTTRFAPSGVQSGMVTDVRARTPENSIAELGNQQKFSEIMQRELKSSDDFVLRDRIAYLENENDILRKEIRALREGQSQQGRYQREKTVDPKDYEELSRRLKQLEAQAIKLTETKKKCVILGIAFERLIADVKAKDKEIERLNKTLKYSENDSRLALDYERVQKERLEKEIERLNKKLDEKYLKKNISDIRGTSELEKQNIKLKKNLDEAVSELEKLREQLMIAQSENERIHHMLAMKDKELDLLRPKILELEDKELQIDALNEELRMLKAQIDESKVNELRSSGPAAGTLKLTLENLVKEREELIQNLEGRNQQIAILEKDVDELLSGYTEFEEIKQKYEAQAAELSLLQRELDNRDKKIESLLKKQREGKDKESTHPDSDVIDLKGQVINLQGFVQERNSMLETLSYKDKEIASLGKHLDKLNEALQESSAENLELQDQVAKHSADVKILQGESISHNKAMEALVQENKGLQNTVINLENLNSKIMGIMSKRDVEIEHLNKLLEETFSELKALREQAKLLGSENERLSLVNQNQSKEIHSLILQSDEKAKELEEMDTNLGSVVQAHKELVDKNETLSQENTDIRRKCENLELSLSSIDKKYKQLEILYLEARGAKEEVEKIHEKLLNVCNTSEEVDPNLRSSWEQKVGISVRGYGQDKKETDQNPDYARI